MLQCVSELSPFLRLTNIPLMNMPHFLFIHVLKDTWVAPLVAQMVKNLPVMQETGVRSLGWEDPLEKETATHSSILAWRIPWSEEPGRLQSMWSQRVGQD